MELAKHIQSRYDSLCHTNSELGEFVRVTIDIDKVFDIYLSGFSEENRQYYNCNSCKSFIRQYGGLLFVHHDFKVETLFDDCTLEEYAGAAKALSEYIKSCPIEGPALFTKTQFNPTINIGTSKHRDMRVVLGKNYKEYSEKHNVHFDHLFLLVRPSMLCDSYEEHRSKFQGNEGTLKRMLKEWTLTEMETILSLLESQNIYRCEPKHADQLAKIIRWKKSLDVIEDQKEVNTIIAKNALRHSNIGHFRNTAIGTLITEYCSGVDLATAVRKYEAMVAPANYKRTKTLATPQMIAAAEKTLTEMGLIDSLYRRHATIEDLSIKDVIYVSRGTENKLKKSPFDAIKSPKVVKAPEGGTEIAIEEFIENVIPNSSKVELYMSPDFAGNLVTLTTQEHPQAPSMFAWNNGFAWSYKGGYTDAVKEQVKKHGGNIEADLRFSLMWDNLDDLDIHVEPPVGDTIYYGHRHSSPTKGELDIDMNIHEAVRGAIENVFFKESNIRMIGEYHIVVNNYRKRGRGEEGCVIQIEDHGRIRNIKYDQTVSGRVTIAKGHYDGKQFNLTYANGTVTEAAPKELDANSFKEIELICLSPNQWGNNPTGHKHYMFLGSNFNNPEDITGFYPEFLNSKLVPHRKSLEMLAGKMKIPFNEKQLSGLGFISTVRKTLKFKVTINDKPVMYDVIV